MREKCIGSISPLLAEMEKEFGEQKFLVALPFLGELRNYLDEHR